MREECGEKAMINRGRKIISNCSKGYYDNGSITIIIMIITSKIIMIPTVMLLIRTLTMMITALNDNNVNRALLMKMAVSVPLVIVETIVSTVIVVVVILNY